MNQHQWLASLTAGALLLASGCASPGKRTGIGAGAGAVGGAAVGGLAGGGKGALLGGLAGAALGAGVGNYLDKQANELEQVADTERTTNGILVKLKSDLLFETDSALLKGQSDADLAELGQILAKYPDDRIRVEGYTDSLGEEKHNEDLSRRRAEAVKNHLIAQGVPPQQLITVGLGEGNPVGDNKTVGGRAENRRVELKIDVPNQKKTG